MPIVTAIEKQKHISSTAKNVAAGIPIGLSLDDSDGHREAAEFISKLSRFGLAYARTAVFHDRIQSCLKGKWFRLNQTINRYPHVKAARDLADNQEALFIADSFVTTADGDVPVPSGNYNVDGGTAAEPASYWKLWVLELLKEGGISWLKMFNHWFGNSKFAQGDLTVHKYADQKFRVPQL